MKPLTFTHDAKTNRVYLGINRESIWITRPTDHQMESLKQRTVRDIEVVRYKSESRILYYIKCGEYNSLVSAKQAAAILFAQGRIKAEEISNISKPEQFDKLVNLRTVQQVPYWIEAIEEVKEIFPNRASRVEKYFVINFKEHQVAKFSNRADAQKAVKMLIELGEPTLTEGVMTFANSTFTLHTVNWYEINPCTAFTRIGGTRPRTQFQNLCTALVPYVSSLPVPFQALASAPSPVRTGTGRTSRAPKKKAALSAPKTTKQAKATVSKAQSSKPSKPQSSKNAAKPSAQTKDSKKDGKAAHRTK